MTALILIAGEDASDPSRFDIVHLDTDDILSGIIRRYIADSGYSWWAIVAVHPHSPTVFSVLGTHHSEGGISDMRLPLTVHLDAIDGRDKECERKLI
jgi:hypothetical protein